MGRSPKIYLTDEEDEEDGLLATTKFRNSFESKGPRNGICQNLMQRELHGSRIDRSGPFGPDKRVPKRLRIPIDEIIPRAALEAGHIFMGFTDCGTFLLSYTILVDNLSEESWSDLNFYRLHYWHFRPYAKATKIASVTLFDDAGVLDNNLLIKITSWPRSNRLLIVGQYAQTSKLSRSSGHTANNNILATLTTLPDLGRCQQCSYALQVDDDDVIGAGVGRVPCLRHGLTIHLSFEHVPPYPTFHPELSMRTRDSVFFNTGNVLHFFSFTPPSQTPLPKAEKTSPETRLKCGIWFKEPQPSLPLNSHHSEDWNPSLDHSYSLNALESLLTQWPPPSHTLGLPLKPKNRLFRRLSQSSIESDSFSLISSISDSTSIAPTPSLVLPQPSKSPQRLLTPSSSQKVMPPPGERRKFFKRGLNRVGRVSSRPEIESKYLIGGDSGGTPSNSSTSSTSGGGGPLSVFDVFEIRGEETLSERNFSSFRKRRLAEKKYAFDDTDENILPLKLTRRSQRGGGGPGPSPSSSGLLSIGESNYPDSSPGGRSPTPLRGLSVSPAMSPGYSSCSDHELVLRPLNINVNLHLMGLGLLRGASPSMSPSPSPFEALEECKGSKTGMNTLEDGKSGALWDRGPDFSPYIDCISRIERIYYEEGDGEGGRGGVEEDEEPQLHPLALSIAVHGGGYRKMKSKVKGSSNSQAGGSNQCMEDGRKEEIGILQRTLDIEVLCNEVAGLICTSSEKSFCSCIDYDIDILDVTPGEVEGESGSVRVMVAMLLHATKVPKRRDPPTLRLTYETAFTFEWWPSRLAANVLFIGNLTEIPGGRVPETWHPVQRIADLRRKRTSLNTTKNTANTLGELRVMSNELAIRDSVSLEEIVDPTGMIRLTKREFGPINPIIELRAANAVFWALRGERTEPRPEFVQSVESVGESEEDIDWA